MTMNKELIADIQEVTAICFESGVFSRLFEDGSMSRVEIMELFAEWGAEFHELHKDFIWDGTSSYYDEIDAFLNKKIKERENPYIDQYGEPYDAEGSDRSWPAGGGLHKDCNYNAEALYAYYTIKDRDKIAEYLIKKEFVALSLCDGFEEWMKGNTKIEFESYADGKWGYVHTELM